MSKLGDYLMESFLVAIVTLVILGVFALIYMVSFWIGLICTIIFLIAVGVAIGRAAIYDYHWSGHWWWEKWRKKKNA